MGRTFRTVTATAILVLLAKPALAAHPLITDDTGTQGKGKAQVEIVGAFGHDEEEGVTVKSFEFPLMPVLSYGLSDRVDLVLGASYEFVVAEHAGTRTAARGMSDTSIEVKARLYENDGLSFAVRPGLSLPTGDEEKGLGNGKTSYSAFFIATWEAQPWAFHFNAGYLRNEFTLPANEESQRKDIWHLSLASQVEVAKGLSLVADVGVERNPDKTSNVHPAFALGGLIYSVRENLALDVGVKGGLNRPETDVTLLAGVTWKR